MDIRCPPSTLRYSFECEINMKVCLYYKVHIGDLKTKFNCQPSVKILSPHPSLQWKGPRWTKSHYTIPQHRLLTSKPLVISCIKWEMSTIWNIDLEPWLCVKIVLGCCLLPLGFKSTNATVEWFCPISEQSEVDFSSNISSHSISSKVSIEEHEAHEGISIFISPSSAFRPSSNCNAPLISSITSFIVREKKCFCCRQKYIILTIFMMVFVGKLKPRVGLIFPMLPESSKIAFNYSWA